MEDRDSDTEGDPLPVIERDLLLEEVAICV